MGHGNQRLEIELLSFYACLDYQQLRYDLIKNEWASTEIPFYHYKFMGNVLDLKGS